MKGLEYAADCKAHIVGKPSKDFFLAALEGTNPSEAVMIGDVCTKMNKYVTESNSLSNILILVIYVQDTRDDVGGAQATDIKGILVKTGKYVLGDENLISPLPLATVENFSAAVDLIIRNNAS